MKYIEKHPMIMIIVGILGISMSAIFVRFSTAPSAVTAAFFAGFLFGEIPSMLLFVGGFMILGGVLFYSGIETK